MIKMIVVSYRGVGVGVGMGTIVGVVYQRRHFSGRFIGDPAGHWKVLMKSGELERGPMTRYLPGECGLVSTWLSRAPSV